MIDLNKLATIWAVAFCCCSLSSFCAGSNPWRIVPESALEKAGQDRQIVPQKYLTLQLDQTGLQDILAQAPPRFSPESYGKEVVLELPMPDGKTERFQIFSAPVMHPELAAKYPMIHSYSGIGIDDPTASVRFGVTQFGFHAIILSGRHNPVFIDPYAKNDTEHHIAYFKKDYQKETSFVCGFTGDADMDAAVHGVEKVQGDCMFRTYRLALACTGEYANFHGGNKPDVMAAFATTMTRVNGIYERDFGLTMVMVPNNDTLIFLDAGTDPYTNNNGGQMLGQNQDACDDLIGPANYDIGHVFSTGGGGIASLRAPCNGNNKAQGVTGLPSPIGDPFDVDYVAHEMGHQYGANHTQNNNCNRVLSTAMEPGSASTIMGYAGICNPNVQNNSDDYFHAISIQEIAQNITNGSGSSCPVTEDLGNNAPTVDGGKASYTLPISTPFRLTAVGFDADGDSLTYCWEQMDNEPAPMPPVSTSTGGPAFRSIVPVNEPYRYFPKLTDVINDIDDTWEELPAVSRNMKFRVTVRDNNLGLGCTEEDDVALTFTADSGPFLVQDPNTSDVEWFVTEPRTISWDVAGTDLAPVSCANVDILLSTDGGLTYPDTLAANVPNTGSYNIIVPFKNSTTCRVMIFCSDNVFYDISDENFTITPPPYPTFLGSVSPASQEVCGSVDSVVYNIDYIALSGFSALVSMSATGAPAGATVTFSQDTLTPSASISLTIGNLASVASGDYTIQIVGVGDTIVVAQEVALTVANGVPAISSLASPEDGATGLPFTPALTWEATATANQYFIEIATSPAFGNTIVESGSTFSNQYVPANLADQTVYYWRVRSANICGESGYSAWRSFQTGARTCQTFSSTDTPLNIPAFVGTTVSSIPVSEDVLVAEVNLDMEIPHTWVGHLSASLIAPSGRAVALFDRPGFPADPNNGCRRNNMLVSFDDDAANSAEDLENMCLGSGNYTIIGAFQPLEPLAGFFGENALGNWQLSVVDSVPGEGGSIQYWNLEICYLQDFTEALNFAKLDLVVDAGATENITSNQLFSISPTNSAAEITYTLLSLPTQGALTLNGMPAAIGDSFTQADINNNLISYTNTNVNATTDQFRFDVTTNSGGWVQNESLNILIGQEALLAAAVLTNDISCNNAADGSVTVLASGSHPPFTFSSNGIDFAPASSFTDLEEGTYTFYVLDAKGDTLLTNMVAVTNPPALVVDTDLSGNNLAVNATGGTGTLSYSLNGIDFQDSNFFFGLPNDDYTITVQDENGCSTSVFVSINIILAADATTMPVSCFNGTDGVLTIDSINGGVTPYAYSLDGINFQDSNEFSDLPSGDYTIYVRDAGGFVFEKGGFTIENAPELTVTASLDMNNLTANATGGTGDLLFTINGIDFQDSTQFNDLPNGTYVVTVVDANGCEASSDSITVNFTNTRKVDFDLAFALFPNPAKDQVNLILEQPAETAMTLRILDVTGRVVREMSVEKTSASWQFSINVDQLPAGSYELLLTDGRLFGRKRFVKM